MAQPAEAPTFFAVIGDFGEAGPGLDAVAAQVSAWAPPCVVTTGDNNYPDGRRETFESNVAQPFAPFIAFAAGYDGPSRARGRPSGSSLFFPSLGNHEWHTPGAADHLALLELPGNGRYYVVNHAPVSFFIVDSDPHEPDGVDAASAQAQWLKTSLAESTAKIKIVVFHHPPYSVGPHASATWMQWPFKAWGASLVMNGHNHQYERHIVDGLPYVVNGMGGATLHREYVPKPPDCRLPSSSFDLCYFAEHGAMRAVLHADRVEFFAVSTSGVTIDRFSLPL